MSIKEELLWFGKNRIYRIILGLTALGAYGFFMIHPTIGIDDTAIEMYFQEGLAPAVGRFFQRKVI